MAAINFPSNPTSGQTFVHTVSDGGFQDHDIVYKWDGTSWIAYNDGTHNRILTQSSTINVHSDVDTSTISPQASDILTWTANNTWEPQQATGGSVVPNSAIAETGIEVQIDVRVVTKTTDHRYYGCLLYTSPSPRDQRG